MSDNPKISIILPVYNAQRYLRACLKGIINQTFKDIEIICVNDGSTDGSGAILEEFAADDKRIKIVAQKNQGAAIARNIGISRARGEYLSFLDADDIAKPRLIEKLYNQALATDADVVLCGSVLIESVSASELVYTYCPPKVDLLPKKIFSYKDIPDSIFQVISPTAWDKLFRKNFILKNDLFFQNLPSCNDVAFMYLAALKAKRISYTDEILYSYRYMTESSISSRRGELAENILKAMQNIKNELIKDDIFYEVEKSFYNRAVHTFKYELSHVIRTKKYKKVLKEFRKFLPPEFKNDLPKKESFFLKTAKVLRIKWFDL